MLENHVFEEVLNATCKPQLSLIYITYTVEHEYLQINEQTAVFAQKKKFCKELT